MSKTYIYLDFIKKNDEGMYELEGYLGGAPLELQDVRIFANSKQLPIQLVNRVQAQDGLDAQNPVPGTTFKTTVTIHGRTKITARHNSKRIRIRVNRFTRLSNRLFTYSIKEEDILSLFQGSLIIQNYTKPRHILFELFSVLSLFTSMGLQRSVARTLRAEGLKQKLVEGTKGLIGFFESLIKTPRDILLRLNARLVRKKKLIWIISDRQTTAGDNGHALFEYISDQATDNVDVYFAIDKDSADFETVSSIGKTLHNRSYKYLLKFLQADMIISSHADGDVTNPFRRQVDRFSDLFDFDFVFLQHGVIRHDLSGWLNRYNKDISLFITTSKQERRSILKNNYYYNEQNVLLSGMPRYDKLESEPKNEIVITPTYRQYLLKGRTDKKGRRPYNPQFKKSKFYDFYQRLIKDPDINKALDEKDIKAEFLLHPNFEAQLTDFEGSKSVRITRPPYNYKQLFKHGDLLISDHSSVVFDFAYLQKPVLYAQFDNDMFYEGHAYTKSVFYDEEKDGFGEVCKDFDGLKHALLQSIKNDMKLSPTYKKRINNYFAFNDRKNSERVYRAILELQERRQETVV